MSRSRIATLLVVLQIAALDVHAQPIQRATSSEPGLQVRVAALVNTFLMAGDDESDARPPSLRRLAYSRDAGF